MRGLGDVLPTQQLQDFTCGAATLLAVLRHWGVRDATEPELTREIGIDPKTGSTSDQVARAARARGFNARVQRFESLADAKALTDRDVPIIAAIHSFNRPGQGHFVVVTDIDDKGVRMMDPNVRTNQRTLTAAHALKRWQGRGGYGIVVTPKRSRLGDGIVAPRKSGKTVALVIAGWALVVGVIAWRQGSLKRAIRDF